MATGKFIIYQNIYDSLIQLTNKDVLLAKYNDKFGVIDLKGNQVLNFNYSTYKISGNTLSLSADDRIYPFDIQTLASAKIIETSLDFVIDVSYILEKQEYD